MSVKMDELKKHGYKKADAKTITDFNMEFLNIVGLDPVKFGTMEECNELAQALSKVYRWDSKPVPGDETPWSDKNITNLIEEISDVMICINMVCSLYHIEPKFIHQMMNYKLHERSDKAKAGVYSGKITPEEFFNNRDKYCSNKD